MGTEYCKPGTIISPIKNTDKIDELEREEPFISESIDPTELDDSPSPLIKYIKQHSKDNPICASNSLNFQSSEVLREKENKVESVKMVKPKPSRGGRSNPRPSIS